MALLQKLARRDLRENVFMALDTLRNNKLRSALTLISVSVAVTTLIAVVAILMGLDRNIKDLLQGYGTNTAFFAHLAAGNHFGKLSREERLRKPLNYDDSASPMHGVPCPLLHHKHNLRCGGVLAMEPQPP